MLKIRNNVFETNSSSSHSLVYSQKNPNNIEYKLKTENGVLTIHFRTYGWYGPESLTSFGTDDILLSSNDKLDYVISKLCRHLNWSDDDEYLSRQKAEKMIENGVPYNIPEVETLLKEIKSLCPEVKEIKFELNEDEFGDPFGEIDHQSQNLLDNENLIDVIFNKGCMIVIDNDNSNYYHFFDSELEPGINHKSWPGGSTWSVYNITEKDFEK